MLHPLAALDGWRRPMVSDATIAAFHISIQANGKRRELLKGVFKVVERIEVWWAG